MGVRKKRVQVEIFQVIESISEVDHVHSVSLQSNVQMLEISVNQAKLLRPKRSYPDHSLSLFRVKVKKSPWC